MLEILLVIVILIYKIRNVKWGGERPEPYQLLLNELVDQPPEPWVLHR